MHAHLLTRDLRLPIGDVDMRLCLKSIVSKGGFLLMAFLLVCGKFSSYFGARDSVFLFRGFSSCGIFLI